MSALKERKTFTLSHESAEFLASERRLRKAASTSSVLDQILLEQKRQRDKQRFDAAVTNYYDTISNELAEEDSLWGELAETEFRETHS